MCFNRFKLVLIFLNIGLFNFQSQKLLAQIKPDRTLGSESSQVTVKGKTQEIRGGARRGNNLFHSFEQFSVDQRNGIQAPSF